MGVAFGLGPEAMGFGKELVAAGPVLAAKVGDGAGGPEGGGR